MNRYRIVFDAKFSCQGSYNIVRSSALVLADSKEGALERFGEKLTLGASLKVKPAYLNGDITIIRVEEGWKWNSRQRKEKIDDAIKTLRLYLSPEEFNSIFVQGTSEYKDAEKELTLLINRLCEAILFDWKDAADLARKTLTQIKAREEEK